MHGNEVFQRVRDALAQVEAERNVRVLFACERHARKRTPAKRRPVTASPLERQSGSRAWGFTWRDGDYRVSGWELRKGAGAAPQEQPSAARMAEVAGRVTIFCVA